MKKIKCAIILIMVFLSVDLCLASSSYIESMSKTRRPDGYLFKINYQTTQEWTDGLILKLFCTFSKGAELSFTSAANSNLKKGWHKAEINISNTYRERYGYIKDYRVEMYSNGILISIKSM